MIKGILDTGSVRWGASLSMLACPLAVKHAVLEAWDAFPFSVPAPRKCQHFCWEVLHTHKPSGGCLGCWHDSLAAPPITRGAL